MKSPFLTTLAVLAGASLVPSAPLARAGSVYGVSGPRGAAVVGEDRAAAVTRRGVAVTGPNGTAVARRPVAVAPGPVVVAPRPAAVVAPLPAGYVRVVPAGYRTVVYRGYTCRLVGGVYYRPVMYQGSTVYVVVH